MAFTCAQLREEYATLWRTMQIKSSAAPHLDRILRNINANKPRYLTVAAKTNVPWEFIAATHTLEASQNFARHLHNGDPLNARTVQVPRGRPKTGNPPFTWEESAIDALTMHGHQLHLVPSWPIERVLFELERYNGWGYRLYHPSTKSPYLWSFTNHYRSGKYVRDGKWDADAVSTQMGAAAIIKRLIPQELRPSEDNEPDEDTETLQQVLNSFGAKPPLVVDGKYGDKTRAAVKEFQTKAGLQVDGIAGEKTWAAIKLRLNVND